MFITVLFIIAKTWNNTPTGGSLIQWNTIEQ